MALPSSGEMKHSMIQGEFGGSHPIKLNEYYGVASGVPEDGTISNGDFYGTAAETDGPVVTMTGGTNSAQILDRYGFGLSGKTTFVHPETGSNTNAFGSVTQSTDVAGGLDLLGVQVANYALNGKYFIMNDAGTQMVPHGEGNWKHITITIDGLTSTQTWTKVHFYISNNYVTLNRSQGFRQTNSVDRTYITWRPTYVSSGANVSTSNFSTVWSAIYGTRNGGTLALYFE